MTTAVDIVNSALAKIGEEPISSLDEARHAARTAKTQYPLLKKRLLRQYNWRFAMARAVLAPVTTAPEFGFKYKFLLPTDCLRVVGVYTKDDPHGLSNYTSNQQAFKVEGPYLLYSKDTVYLHYVRDVEDPGQFDSVFVETLVWLLVIDFALSIANSATRAEQAKMEFRETLRVAKLTSAIETGPEILIGGTWLPHDDGSWSHAHLPAGVAR